MPIRSYSLRSQQDTLAFVHLHMPAILTVSLLRNDPHLRLVDCHDSDLISLDREVESDCEKQHAARCLLDGRASELILYDRDSKEVASLTTAILSEAVSLMSTQPRYAPYWRQWAACPAPSSSPSSSSWIEEGCFHACVALLQVACANQKVFYPQLDNCTGCWGPGDQALAAAHLKALQDEEKEQECLEAVAAEAKVAWKRAKAAAGMNEGTTQRTRTRTRASQTRRTSRTRRRTARQRACQTERRRN